MNMKFTISFSIPYLILYTMLQCSMISSDPKNEWTGKTTECAAASWAGLVWAIILTNSLEQVRWVLVLPCYLVFNWCSTNSLSHDSFYINGLLNDIVEKVGDTQWYGSNVKYIWISLWHWYINNSLARHWWL